VQGDHLLNGRGRLGRDRPAGASSGTRRRLHVPGAAAGAETSGAAVLHDDRDCDTLAEVMEFESIWLAPAGSLA